MDKKDIGLRGERVACDYLLKRGYSIVLCNYYSKYGEIDIIAKNEKYIIFVEVKTRKKDSTVPGVFAVDKNKQKKIIKTAMAYIDKSKTGLQPRFDVIEVINLVADKEVGINYIENAFFSQEGDSFETV